MPTILTKEQTDLLRLAKVVNKIKDLEEKVKKLEEKKDPISDEEKIEKITIRLATRLAVLEKGEKGDKGDKGESVVGRQGIQGKTGERGLQGVKGDTGERGLDGKDGKDADEEMIIEKASQIATEAVKKLIPKIEDIKKDLPKLGEEIRDALELLNGEERLSISAIKGLRKRLGKGEKMLGRVGRVGGVKSMTYGVETPSGTINGSNKAFTVQWIPLYITINGQMLYEDNGYTLTSSSGTLTITLDNAPQVVGNQTDVLRSHYTSA